MSASSRSNKKAKKGRQQGGFYEPPTAAAQILSRSADGRRLLVQNELIREHVIRTEEAPPPEAGLGVALSDGAAQNVLDDALAPPSGAETIQGVEGMAVVTKTRAKRYPASVSLSL